MGKKRILAAATGILVAALCGSCSTSDQGADGDDTSEPTQEQSQGADRVNPETDEEIMPEGTPLGLEVTQPAGSSEEPVPGLKVTVPDGVTGEDTSSSGLTVVKYRMPNSEDGIPALQVTLAEQSGDSVYAKTWAQEQELNIDPKISEVHRSLEEWPNATQAVAFGWKQQVPMQDGSTLDTEVLTLWLQDADDRSFKLTALAPEGELSGSPVYDALLSATLIGGVS